MSPRHKILLEHLVSKCSVESQLLFISICSVRIFTNTRVMEENMSTAHGSDSDSDSDYDLTDQLAHMATTTDT